MARCTAFLRSERVVVPAKAVAATALYCLIGSLVYAYGQGLSGVEAFYFIVVTMSTVGYGDIKPETPFLRFFCIVYIFLSLLLVFPILTAAIVLLTKGWNESGRRLLEYVNPPTLVDVDGDGIADFRMPERHAAYFFAKNMLPASAMWFLLQVICASGFIAIEGAHGLPGADAWDFGSALYHCIITAATVGYGDLYIATDGGKMWASFHILLSVAMLGELVSTFDTLRSEWAEKKGKMQRLEKKMNPELFTNLISTIEKLDPKSSGGNSVSQMQFLLSHA